MRSTNLKWRKRGVSFSTWPGSYVLIIVIFIFSLRADPSTISNLLSRNGYLSIALFPSRASWCRKIYPYISARKYDMEELRRWCGKEDVQKEIQDALTDRANGM
jgi:hypothetical protein